MRSALGGGNSTSYDYDPLGRRRAKTVNGTLTRYVSDNAEEIEERNSANAVLRKYVYGSGIDERIALLDTACAGGRCYYLSNWQGSTTTLVNQTGSSLNATYHYGPYGEAVGWSPLAMPPPATRSATPGAGSTPRPGCTTRSGRSYPRQNVPGKRRRAPMAA